MIKANELRVGNWVDWIIPEPKPTYEQVYELHEDTINEYNSNYYNPIPLSPEILEKAGFEKGDMKDGIRYDNYEKGYYTVMVRGQGITISNRHGYLATIKSLHQLQNLYFALTGEELNIQL